MQKNVQHGFLQFGIIEKVAQAFGEREHPLPYRQARKKYFTGYAAVSTMHRVVQEGHTSRPLQE